MEFIQPSAWKSMLHINSRWMTYYFFLWQTYRAAYLKGIPTFVQLCLAEKMLSQALSQWTPTQRETLELHTHCKPSIFYSRMCLVMVTNLFSAISEWLFPVICLSCCMKLVLYSHKIGGSTCFLLSFIQACENCSYSSHSGSLYVKLNVCKGMLRRICNI